jgi:hypothetical protein
LWPVANIARCCHESDISFAGDGIVHLTLIEQFQRYELDPVVRQRLQEALKRGTNGTRLRDEFDFNRFNVLLDFEQGTVVIEDDLDVSPAGRVEFPIAEFERLLDEPLQT